MPYRLDPAHAIDEELRRVLSEETEGAVRDLRGAGAEAIHEARKHFKKARALLRLARPHIPLQFDAMNVRFRDCGRALAPARDAESMREGWERLRPRFGGDPLFARVAEALSAERDGAESGARAAEVADLLDAAEPPTVSLPLGIEAFAAGLLLAHRAGRRRFREARASRSPLAFHEWRKRTKDLWYHLRLLQMGDPLLLAWESVLEELSRTLGERHDVDLLRERLAAESLTLTDDEGREVDLFLREEGERLSQRALVLGSLVFGRGSAALVDAVIDAWSRVTGPGDGASSAGPETPQPVA